MLGHILNIWGKELMDSVRDKKAIRQALLMPVFLGVFYAVLNPLLGSMIRERAADPLTVPTQGLEYADPALLAILQQFEITLEPYEGNLQGVIALGDEPAGIIIPPGFAESVAAEQPATLTLLVSPARGGPFGGSVAGERLDLAISGYGQQVAIERVEARNLSPALLVPINLDTQNLATPEQLAGLFAAFTLPLLVGLISAQGGMFIAIAVTAGEKERGTLESLLVTPAGDLDIFLGKMLAVFTVTLAPIILTFAGFYLASNLLPESITQGAVLPFRVVTGAILISLPLAIFLTVITMIISIRTKAFKDAQSSLTPLVLGVTLAAMAAAFVPPTEPLLFLIPIYGPSAVVGKLAIGGTMPTNAFLFSVVGSLVAAIIGIVIALRLFNRERLLYSM